MKTFDELVRTPRLMIESASNDGGTAYAYLLSSKKSAPAVAVFSWGGGWDHVSVSYKNRAPSWDEMSEIKRLFFHPDEVCVQIHPLESEYVNMHPHCLHIWRAQNEAMPTPPSWMVGAKKGQRIGDAYRKGREALKGMEDKQ